MATRTATQTGLPAMNGRKVAGIIAALFSYITTLWCVQALVDPSWHAPLPASEAAQSTWWHAYLLAAGIEFVLFKVKGLVFNDKRHDDALGWVAVWIDTLLNAGGMWTYVLRIDDTPAYEMIAFTFNMEPQIANIWALVIALGLGYLLSYGPHRLLRDD